MFKHCDPEKLILTINGRCCHLKQFNPDSVNTDGHPRVCNLYETADRKILVKCFCSRFDQNDSITDRNNKFTSYIRFLKGFRSELEFLRSDSSGLFPKGYACYPEITASVPAVPPLSGRLFTWIAMEKICGQTLEEYLSSARKVGERHGFKQNLFTPGQRLSIMEQTFRAVKALYNKGLFHLDLNPSNIIIEDPSALKLRFIDITSCKRKKASYTEYPFSYISDHVIVCSKYVRDGEEILFDSDEFLTDDQIDILHVKCFRELYIRLFYCGNASFCGAFRDELSASNRTDQNRNPFLKNGYFHLMKNQFKTDKDDKGQIDRDQEDLMLQNEHNPGHPPLFETWFCLLREFEGN